MGRILGQKYQLIRKIGEGGMGSVWEAEHAAIRRRVAVKVMHRTEDESPEKRKRFFREAKAAGEIGHPNIREAKAAGEIGHPNIIEIYDVGVEEDGTAYMVMELLNGVSLGELLLKCKALPAGKTVAIVVQVLSALHATHEKGIIHRDLKPDNVFLSVDARMREDVKL
ncbi:MAG: serine/threonine protein kinase, partial [Myxococcota bacterium]|nr:serine/threonine protein kinase [Myxococcota bacterium]